MFWEDKHKQGTGGFGVLGNDISQGCLGALCAVHRLLLPSWEPDAEGTFPPRWSLRAPHAKIVEGQI